MVYLFWRPEQDKITDYYITCFMIAEKEAAASAAAVPTVAATAAIPANANAGVSTADAPPKGGRSGERGRGGRKKYVLHLE